MRSAFARLLRMGQMTPNQQAAALVRLDALRQKWREVLPDSQIRERAEQLPDRFVLSAADALQLAAALVWCLGKPTGRAFISGDMQLLEAARQLGFQAIQA
jgi:predicted nucleic acid-binding protein